MPDFEEKLNTWKKDGFKVEIFSLGRRTFGTGDRPKVGYRFYDRRKLIFEGDDFGPSPMHNIDGEEAVISLLSFLSLKPGDTDDEYFEKYTPTQLTWCNSMRCEELGLIVNDFENPEEAAG